MDTASRALEDQVIRDALLEFLQTAQQLQKAQLAQAAQINHMHAVLPVFAAALGDVATMLRELRNMIAQNAPAPKQGAVLALVQNPEFKA